MAKFGEKLIEMKEILKYFKLPISSSTDKNFLNVGKKSIVKINDQKSLHTWILTHPHQFTSPVVYNEDYIYSVMDNNVLMKWSVDEDSLTNAEQYEFQETIYAVIPVEKQLLVLFSSGKYFLAEKSSFDLKLLDFSFLKKNENIIWADACKAGKVTEVFCLANNQKNRRYILYTFIIKEDKSASNLIERNFSCEKASLKSWCINRQKSLFFSYWSDGSIYYHTVNDSEASKLFSLKNVDDSSVVAIDCIDSTHIAVARGILKQKECELEIWDSKCAVLKAKKVFKTSPLIYIQIAAKNSTLFIVHNEELSSFPFELLNITFSAAVGKSLPENNRILEYSWDAKTELLEMPSIEKPLSMEICSQDDSHNIESTAERLLNETPEYFKYIQESELVKLLQLAVKYKREKTKNCPRRKFYSLFNIVFSASFNDVLLMKYLKTLNSEEIFETLDLLLCYLSHNVEFLPDSTSRPSDAQILNWTTLIIQTHIEDFYFSKKSQKLLKKLMNVLSVKMEEYEDFEIIQNYFSVLEKKDILPQPFSIGKYSVDSLDI